MKEQKEKIKHYQKLIFEKVLNGQEREMRNILNGRLSNVAKQQSALLDGNTEEYEKYSITLAKNMVKALALVSKADRSKVRSLIVSMDKHGAVVTTEKYAQRPVSKKNEYLKNIRKFTFEEIKTVAETCFYYPWDIIISSCRDRDLVEARQILFVFLQSQGMSWGKAGRILGGRDHSTGIHSKNAFRNNCEVDSSYRSKAGKFLAEMHNLGYFIPREIYENYEGYVRVSGYDLDGQVVKTVNAKLKIQEFSEYESTLP